MMVLTMFYEVEVTVTDGKGGVTAQLISVSVTNENEAPVLTSSDRIRRPRTFKALTRLLRPMWMLEPYWNTRSWS